MDWDEDYTSASFQAAGFGNDKLDYHISYQTILAKIFENIPLFYMVMYLCIFRGVGIFIYLFVSNERNKSFVAYI